MKKQHFWLIVAAVTGLLWAVLGLAMDGIGAAIILGIFSFVGTLLMGGMVCAGSEGNRKAEEVRSDDETLEM